LYNQTIRVGSANNSNGKKKKLIITIICFRQNLKRKILKINDDRFQETAPAAVVSKSEHGQKTTIGNLRATRVASWLMVFTLLTLWFLGDVLLKKLYRRSGHCSGGGGSRARRLRRPPIIIFIHI